MWSTLNSCSDWNIRQALFNWSWMTSPTTECISTENFVYMMMNMTSLYLKVWHSEGRSTLHEHPLSVQWKSTLFFIACTLSRSWTCFIKIAILLRSLAWSRVNIKYQWWFKSNAVWCRCRINVNLIQISKYFIILELFTHLRFCID